MSDDQGQRPAYPANVLDVAQGHDGGRYEVQVQYLGITIRDYFAAAAIGGAAGRDTRSDPEALAKWAYKVAREMLAARQQEAQ